MNKQFKRVEVTTEYGEQILITNHNTYQDPVLDINYMHITHLGEVIWIENCYQSVHRVLPVYQDEYKEAVQTIIKNKAVLYNNPDKEFVIDGFKFITSGISNDYRYV